MPRQIHGIPRSHRAIVRRSARFLAESQDLPRLEQSSQGQSDRHRWAETQPVTSENAAQDRTDEQIMSRIMSCTSNSGEVRNASNDRQVVQYHKEGVQKSAACFSNFYA